MISTSLFYNYFEYPALLLLIIPLILLVIYLLNKDFVKLKIDELSLNKKRKLKIFVLFTRIILILCLVISLAFPYTESTKIVTGDPEIKLLVDSSLSMDVFDMNFIEDFKSNLENFVPVELSYISSGDQSLIGGGILSHLSENDNILLISDGNNNEGVDLGDVALYANSINASISALKLNSKEKNLLPYLLGCTSSSP